MASAELDKVCVSHRMGVHVAAGSRATRQLTMRVVFARVQQYFAEHQVEKALADALAQVIREKPSHPLRRVSALGTRVTLFMVDLIDDVFASRTDDVRSCASQMAQLLAPETYVEPGSEQAQAAAAPDPPPPPTGNPEQAADADNGADAVVAAPAPDEAAQAAAPESPAAE